MERDPRRSLPSSVPGVAPAANTPAHGSNSAAGWGDSDPSGNTPAGDNSQDLSPHTGFPAITVPMGFVGEGLPAGLTILGDAWSEPRLIELAYAYEQATQHRRPPPACPPLD